MALARQNRLLLILAAAWLTCVVMWIGGFARWGAFDIRVLPRFILYSDHGALLLRYHPNIPSDAYGNYLYTHGWMFLWLGFYKMTYEHASHYSLVIPYWLILLVLSFFLWRRSRAAYVSWQLDRRRAAGCCLNCGYDLRGSTGPCPECGTERERRI